MTSNFTWSSRLRNSYFIHLTLMWNHHTQRRYLDFAKGPQLTSYPPIYTEDFISHFKEKTTEIQQVLQISFHLFFRITLCIYLPPCISGKNVSSSCQSQAQLDLLPSRLTCDFMSSFLPWHFPPDSLLVPTIFRSLLSRLSFSLLNHDFILPKF